MSADGKQIYCGQFSRHSFEGFGKLVQVGAFEYCGSFKDNKMEGSGHIKYSDGSQFRGSFRNNSKHGRGELVSADGRVTVAIWEDGKVVGETIEAVEKGQTLPQLLFV